uniref:Uncharacterized protein n=1 Tax=Triticum urartu TaxID=4572 RepID=A0A8R7V6C7_TRIUA
MCADEHMQQWKVLHGGRRVVGYIGIQLLLLQSSPLLVHVLCLTSVDALSSFFIWGDSQGSQATENSGMYSLILKLKSERLVEDGVESVAECGSVRLSLLLELQCRYTEINRKVAIARTRLSLMQEDMYVLT